jgi:hypothetical protein
MAKKQTKASKASKASNNSVSINMAVDTAIDLTSTPVEIIGNSTPSPAIEETTKDLVNSINQKVAEHMPVHVNKSRNPISHTEIIKNGFKLFNRTYKQTASSLPQLEPQAGDTIVRNTLQPELKDGGRTAKVHLNTILLKVLGIEENWRQAKQGNSWVFVFDKAFNFEQIETNPRWNIMKDLGFNFDKATKTASFYKADANMEALSSYSKEELQAVYDSIYEAANYSDSLNSKNNLFTAYLPYQKTAFMLEINSIYSNI